MNLEVGDRWHHPVHVFHDPDRPGAAPAAHTGRMSAELGVARALSGVAATVWLGIVAHQLTVRQFGQVTLVLSLGSLVSLGTDLGIPLALAKVACDHDRLDRRAVGRAVLTRTIAGVIAGGVLVALWADAGQSQRWWMAALYSISVVATPLGGSYLALLRGRAIGIVEAAYNVVSKLALLAVGLATLAAGWKPSGVIAAFVVVDVASSLAIPAVARRRLSLTGTADPLQRAALRLRATLPLAAAGIIGSAYERIDIWLLALLKGSASVAVYVAAYKLYDTVLLPANAIASAAVAAAGPRLATDARGIARRLALRAALLTAPIGVVVAVAAPVLLRAAFGGHYGDASGAVTVLMVAALPGASLAAVTPIALLCRRRVVSRWTLAALAGNVVANLALVPAFGARGAALAFLITDSLLLAVFFAVLPGAGPVAGAEVSTVAAGRGKTAPHGDAPAVRLDRGGPLSR
ncbi:MAG TPA: oligosaccharide flippase family protein [Acidimicrobiia bacterium]|nr:oligosaccharide flippase family protein [Acidimicrobiia bacterium]